MAEKFLDIKKGPNLFYNEKGAGQGAAGNDIYIDCQPVGSSDETTEVVTDMGAATMSFGDWLSNPLVKLVLGSLLFIFILYVIKKFLTLFKPAKGGSILASTEVKTGGGLDTVIK